MDNSFPQVNLDVAIEAAEKARRRQLGLDSFLFWCNYFCRFPDINAIEHGEHIEVYERALKIFATRRAKRAEGTLRPEDMYKITILVCAARGTLKTTLDQAFATRLIVEDPLIAIRFNLNKKENAEKKVPTIGRMLRFGRIPDHFGGFYNPGHWSKASIQTHHADGNADPSVLAGGIDERQASTHCDVLINSDCQDKENTQTEVLRKDAESCRSEWQNLYRQNSIYRLEIWDCTRWHKHDIATQIRDASETHPKQVWMIYKPVADVGEWMRDPEGCALHFPTMFPRRKIKELFNPAVSGLREYDVYCQYFLDTSRSEHTKFKESWLAPGPAYNPDAEPGDEGQTNVCLLPKRMNLYVTIDPADAEAIRKAREKGDMISVAGKCDTGMILWGMDQLKHRVEFEAVSAQMTIPDIGDTIIRWYRAYHRPDRKRPREEWPLFGAADRAPRDWTFRRIGVEKVVFSAGAIIEPLRTYLAAQPVIGPDLAKRLLNDRSAIQISTQRSKAGRQDATEVDWANGGVRSAQQQTDINDKSEHPLQALIDAKREYPTSPRWDILDAESLGWGPGFMAAPYDPASVAEGEMAKMKVEHQKAVDLWVGSPGTMNKYYAEQLKKGKAGVGTRYGPTEFVGI